LPTPSAQPTDAQVQTVPHILAGRNVLLSSPTGSGKTLAGFLGVLDHLLRLHEADELSEGIHAIYISPLRALTYDIEKNLHAPLVGIGLKTSSVWVSAPATRAPVSEPSCAASHRTSS